MYNKKKSPNKFLSAGMAALGAISRSGSGQSVMSAGMQAAGLNQQQMSNSFIAGGPGSLFEAAKAAQAAQGIGAAPSTGIVGAAPQVSQAAQAAQAAVNEGAAMGVSNPLAPGTGGPAGSSNPFGGQKFEITPVQMTYETPIPGNERGNANPLFNESVTNAGNTMFGDVGQRQRSLQNQAGDIQATQYIKDPSALQGNAFGSAMDQSEGDYDKAKEIIKNK